MDLGGVALVALLAGLVGGAVGASLVGTIAGMLRRRKPAMAGGGWRSGHRDVGTAQPPRFHGAAPFDDLSDRAKRVLALAQEESLGMNEKFIGTDHLLLGLIKEGEGTAARVLASFAIDLGKARAALAHVDRSGDPNTAAGAYGTQLTPAAKAAIGSAREEAHKLGHTHVGTEHLLLGLVREDGVAMAVARSLGASPEQIRERVIAGLPGPPPAR